MTDKKRYKLSNEIIVNEDGTRLIMIVHFGILALICVMSFLIAKYIVRSEIEGENSPIDTSERL